jgi:preprotein translocase subunit YajC
VQELVSLLPIVGIALLFWLLIIRPASKRQKDMRRMQDALTPGDQVMLTSGIYGRLVSADAEHLLVEVADGVTLRVARGAIAQVVPPQAADDRPADDVDHGTDHESGER